MDLLGADDEDIKCSHCNKKGDTSTLSKCARCKARLYCGRDCQRSDWRLHKKECTPEAEQKWYHKHRLCNDGSMHHGEMELITWDGPMEEEPGETMGWGNTVKPEDVDLKRKYEEEFGRDDAKLFDYWPQAFRWTCCGTDAGMEHGCDHHGAGPRPCRCDFCEMGQALPDGIYFKRTSERHDLELPRGPDPRSYKGASHVRFTQQMRHAVGF